MTAPQPAPPHPTGRPNASLRKTVLDMVWSLLAVLGVVAAVLVFVWRPHEEAVKPVDIGMTLTLATREAPFTPMIADPDADPMFAAWVPTSARFEPTAASDDAFVWHVGYVVDGGTESVSDDEFVQLVQSIAASPEFVAEQTADGVAGEMVDIDGIDWTRYETPDRRSLVRTAPAGEGAVDGEAVGDETADAVTTIVSGTLDWPALESATRALQ